MTTIKPHSNKRCQKNINKIIIAFPRFSGWRVRGARDRRGRSEGSRDPDRWGEIAPQVVGGRNENAPPRNKLERDVRRVHHARVRGDTRARRARVE